jgi:hypothetical protein
VRAQEDSLQIWGNMRRCTLPGLLLASLLVGCSSSTGILPAGPDTYTVTERLSPMLGGGTGAERVALNEANDFCERHGRKFLTVDMAEGGNHTQWGGTGYSVTFHCFLPSDPRLLQFQFAQPPEPDAATAPPKQ